MRQSAAMLLLLMLAGCSSSSSLFHRDEPRPDPLTSQVAPQAEPQVNPNRANMSPAASAAAPKDEGNERPGELLDCVTESCRINCSPKVAERFRPKWCARFKEPS